MKKRDLLYFCSGCKDKTDEEISKISCTIEHTLKRFERGEYIAYQGDRVRYLPLLVEGEVRTEIVSDSGFVLAVEVISAPYPLASAFLFSDENTFPVDVIATRECEVAFIPKSEVERQMAQCNGFLRGFLAFSSNRMHFMSQRLKVFAQKGIKAKLAYYIITNEKGGKFSINKSVTFLANYFGVERTSLSRAIKEMVQDGVISYKSGEGEILDSNKLEEILS